LLTFFSLSLFRNIKKSIYAYASSSFYEYWNDRNIKLLGIQIGIVDNNFFFYYVATNLHLHMYWIYLNINEEIGEIKHDKSLISGTGNPIKLSGWTSVWYNWYDRINIQQLSVCSYLSPYMSTGNTTAVIEHKCVCLYWSYKLL
jgi:hypothetical protein